MTDPEPMDPEIDEAVEPYLDDDDPSYLDDDDPLDADIDGLDEAIANCYLRADGDCLAAGSEYCEWKCPFRDGLVPTRYLEDTD